MENELAVGLLPTFLLGALASGLSSAAYFYLKRRFTVRREELEIQRIELKLQREMLERQKALSSAKANFPIEQYRDLSQILARAELAKDAGLYDAAIILSSAALEDAIRRTSDPGTKGLPLKSIIGTLETMGRVDPESVRMIHDLWSKRNKTVHHLYESDVSKENADTYLKQATEVLIKLVGTDYG